jgi:hypothetical protein
MAKKMTIEQISKALGEEIEVVSAEDLQVSYTIDNTVVRYIPQATFPVNISILSGATHGSPHNGIMVPGDVLSREDALKVVQAIHNVIELAEAK